jgi:hypothetical protein
MMSVYSLPTLAFLGNLAGPDMLVLGSIALLIFFPFNRNSPPGSPPPSSVLVNWISKYFI